MTTTGHLRPLLVDNFAGGGGASTPPPSLIAAQREAARELSQRQRLLPNRVASGRLLQTEADDLLAVAAAWVEDVGRVVANFADCPLRPMAPATHGLTFSMRRSELLREADMRARLYPKWVAEGRVLKAEADAYSAALEAILALYEDGPLFEARNGAVPRWWGAPGRTYEEREARIEWLLLQHSRTARLKQSDMARIIAHELSMEGVRLDGRSE